MAWATGGTAPGAGQHRAGAPGVQVGAVPGQRWSSRVGRAHVVPAEEGAHAAWARAQQQAREAALTAEQRIALALTLGRRARAIRALAKP